MQIRCFRKDLSIVVGLHFLVVEPVGVIGSESRRAVHRKDVEGKATIAVDPSAADSVPSPNVWSPS